MNNFDDLLTNAPATEQNGAQLSKEDYATKKKSERDEIFELSDNTALEVAGYGDVFQQYIDNEQIIVKKQLDFVTNAEAGSGLMRIGNAIVPYENRFPKGALYNLMTTKPFEK